MHLACLHLKWLFSPCLFVMVGITFWLLRARRAWARWGWRSVTRWRRVMFNCDVWTSRAALAVFFSSTLTNHSHWLKLQPSPFVRCVIIFLLFTEFQLFTHSTKSGPPCSQQQGRAGGRLLIISGATLEGATLFMPITPSGGGVISLMSNTPVLWSSLFSKTSRAVFLWR